MQQKQMTLVTVLAFLSVALILGLCGCGGVHAGSIIGGGGSPERIVFESRASALSPFNIWWVNPDGTNLTQVTHATSGGANSHNPQWSPDGSTIIFESSRKLDGSDAGGIASNIWRVKADGTGLTAVTRATPIGADSYKPQWSPDGKKIVFVSTRKLDGSDAPNTNNAQNIWRVNADGTGLVPLTRSTATLAFGAGDLQPTSTSPQWSPDGSKIVFVSTRLLDGTDATSAAVNIWRMNADGTGLMPLTRVMNVNVYNNSPKWSPDGSKIIFVSNRALGGSDTVNIGSLNNIWQVNADGTGLKALTQNPPTFANGTVNPQYSPDGSKIVFVTTRFPDGGLGPSGNGTGAPTNVWMMRADGSDNPAPVTNITTFGLTIGAPQWSRDGSKVVFHTIRNLDGTDSAGVAYNIWRASADGSGLIPLTHSSIASADSISPQVSR